MVLLKEINQNNGTLNLSRKAKLKREEEFPPINKILSFKKALVDSSGIYPYL